MKNKSRNFSRYIALYAVIAALTVVASFLPYVFLVPLLFVAVSFGLGTTVIASLMFGVISLALSFAGGASFVPLVFIEFPIIPIVPRLLAGLATYFTHLAFTKLIKKEGRLKTYLPKAIAAGVGSVANTVFVVSLMYLFIPSGKLYGGVSLDAFVLAIALPNSIIEAAITVLVVPALAVAVCRALRLTKFREMLSGYSIPARKLATATVVSGVLQEDAACAELSSQSAFEAEALQINSCESLNHQNGDI